MDQTTIQDSIGINTSAVNYCSFENKNILNQLIDEYTSEKKKITTEFIVINFNIQVYSFCLSVLLREILKPTIIVSLSSANILSVVSSVVRIY